MVTRHKPIFYRRKRRYPGVILLLAVTGVLAFVAFNPLGNPFSIWAGSLPALYQWIPAAILWMVLLVMLSVAVFRGEKE